MDLTPLMQPTACFLLYSMLGWAYESIMYTVKHCRPINRGFLKGPWCPIYGSGAALDLLLLGNFSNLMLQFALGAALACALEYVTSYTMEQVFHARWWDYSARLGNLRGRVCVLGAVVFGLFAVVLITFLHPLVLFIFSSMPDFIFHTISVIAALAFLLDVMYTLASKLVLPGWTQELSRVALPSGIEAITRRIQK